MNRVLYQTPFREKATSATLMYQWLSVEMAEFGSEACYSSFQSKEEWFF